MRSPPTYELRRGALKGVLLRLLGQRFRGIRLTESGVILLARKPREISFSDMADPPRTERVFGFSAISIPLADGSELKVAGLKRADAQSFVEAAKQTWRRSIAQLFDAANEELHALAAVVERLEQPRRYPSACLLQPFTKRADALLAKLPKTYPEGFISVEQRQMLEAVSEFQAAPEKMRDTAIDAFIDAELAQMKDFFDTIEPHPLTPEQRLAVVTDEDATLVLAGAGSGKTSVIVAKAAYLVQRGIRKPEEILLMAFGRDAAEVMATRIKERCGSPVDARTFHALGNEIIRQVEGQAPALAPHASDEAQFQALLRDILISDIATRKGPGAVLLSWFTEFYRPYKSEWDFKTKDEYDQYVEANELRTLQGEVVKSFEELEIANWLYSNGVDYEYEPIYEHDLPENNRRVYTPDFRLTESGVYIEHFGVRRELAPDGTIRLTTASYVDRERYLADMAWKRKVHEDHGTILIETFSYDRVEGRLTCSPSGPTGQIELIA